MQILVNDEHRKAKLGETLADLVLELGLNSGAGIAVALDNTLVPRARWAETALFEGARILIVRASQGG